MIGASGAIAAVLGGYLLLYPRSRVLTWIFFFVPLVRLPAVIFLGLWFFLQLLWLPEGPAGGVAFGAHVGGFLAGITLVRLFGTSGLRTTRARARAW